jgi:hypothetical protein
MRRDEAYTALLENELRQARETIRFMHGCLTNDKYKYAYPEMTDEQIASITRLVPDDDIWCVHSIYKVDCQGCQQHIRRMTKRHEAKKVYFGEEDNDRG